MTSTHLEAILILSSEPSALFLFRIRILSFSIIFHPFQFLPGRTVEGRSAREPHDVRFPSFPLPRMRESQPPDISGKLSPASIHSIEHTKKSDPLLFEKGHFVDVMFSSVPLHSGPLKEGIPISKI